ncbi:MAG: preprotein translocase subunit SecA, partial [Chloroflexia bacterium]|nr:preprotein translocase subunit SecA [Chloroflexia bacterium]
MGIGGFLNKFLGKKSDRDIKEIWPIVESVKEEYENITKLSNDELRAKTEDLKAQIVDFVKEEENEKVVLKTKAESDETDIVEREDIYREIDKLDEKILSKIEEKLNDILPTAFSIVKETAKRFNDNETIEVTANDFDKKLAAKKENVVIKGDKAIYKNKWIAGG